MNNKRRGLPLLVSVRVLPLFSSSSSSPLIFLLVPETETCRRDGNTGGVRRAACTVQVGNTLYHYLQRATKHTVGEA